MILLLRKSASLPGLPVCFRLETASLNLTIQIRQFSQLSWVPNLILCIDLK